MAAPVQLTLDRADTDSRFDQLCSDVHTCLRCERMSQSVRVLGRASGPIDAKVMFVGEAPGRLGADESAIPFHGDKAGHNFEQFLSQVGLSRYEVFVTNAVLCNPRDMKGNNATPTRLEVSNCSGYLKRQIDLLDPKVVVALGSTALAGLSAVSEHGATLSQDVRKSIPWFGRLLIPLYHPGQRALVHRSFANQLADWQFVAETVCRIGVKPASQRRAVEYDSLQIVDLITAAKPVISYFALHKLYFLVEYLAYRELGARFSSGFIVRQKDGPYCVDLHYSKLLGSGLNLKLLKRGGKLYLSRELQGSLLLAKEKKQTAQLSAVVKKVIAKYASLSDRELKTAVYLTSPMRKIMKKEKAGANMFNVPIDL